VNFLLTESSGLHQCQDQAHQIHAICETDSEENKRSEHRFYVLCATGREMQTTRKKKHDRVSDNK